MLTVQSLELAIGGSRILRGVDFEVPDNQCFCLMGRNGVGKTSTLRSITGVLKPSAGKITLAGQDITKLSSEARAAAGIGYVPQGRDIFPQLTVEENLHIGAIALGKKLNGSLDRVFALFPILKEFLPRKGGMLSGGQQQQLAIGRALLTKPKLLILDEPTEGIQPSIIDQIGDTLKKLKAPQATADVFQRAAKDVEEIKQAVQQIKQEHALAILLVEQYVDFCREVADRYYAMDRGAVVVSGTIATLTDEVVKKHLQV